MFNLTNKTKINKFTLSNYMPLVMLYNIIAQVFLISSFKDILDLVYISLTLNFIIQHLFIT